VAEENTALVADDGAQAPEIVEEGQQQPSDDTPEPIANLARDLGWTPREEWHGEPEKWKPAEQFIRDGREIQQTTSRELKAMREQMERLGGVTETIVRDKVAERDAYWQQQFNQAVEDGDTEKATALLDKRPTAQPAQQGPDPQVSAWVAKNPWFNTDPLAQARAQELSERLKHLPVADQLAQVERAVRKEFPEHFPKAKDPPATQTAEARNTRASNRVKGFADMPAESQAVARDMMRRHPDLTLEAFAKSYWADQATKQRRA
jgi:hypothetical protein